MVALVADDHELGVSFCWLVTLSRGHCAHLTGCGDGSLEGRHKDKLVSLLLLHTINYIYDNILTAKGVLMNHLFVVEIKLSISEVIYIAVHQCQRCGSIRNEMDTSVMQCHQAPVTT